MRWHKFISTILHPVLMPTIGVIIYFFISPMRVTALQQIYLLSIVFIATYAIPILLLFFLKSVNKIESFEVRTIQERKIPMFSMMCIFLLLGRFFYKFSSVRELSYLFFGTLLGLIIIYFIFFTKTKTSLHLLSIGSAVGFFIVYQQINNVMLLPLIVVFILLSGFLGTSRLNLKAHTPKEVYLGFLIGITSQLVMYYVLQ